jgi:copper resistance protein B
VSIGKWTIASIVMLVCAIPVASHAEPTPADPDTATHAHSHVHATEAAHSAHADMTMDTMQGGKAPTDARSPDYSDGLGHSHMVGMDMLDNAALGTLLIDQLEATHDDAGNGQSWEVEGWYGNDLDKLWLRSEGERHDGKTESADLELLWNRSASAFWNTQLGVRHDVGIGPTRDWAAFGIEGLAPYFVELEGTVYVGQGGRVAARLRGEYEILFTQRLILQPEVEVNAFSRADPLRRLGAGIADAEFGLRLRYEIRREFAPYVGVVWSRRFGETADFARADGDSAFDRQWVAGFRFWF